MNARKAKHGWIWTLVFTVISLFWIYPTVLVLINSFKRKSYISRSPFAPPTGKMFVGLENYVTGIEKTGLIQAFGYSVVITVCSVAAIILLCACLAVSLTAFVTYLKSFLSIMKASKSQFETGE